MNINGINFNNLPTDSALGFSQYLTRYDNLTREKTYSWDDGDPVLAAVDIDWCGAQLPNSNNLGTNLSISNTSDLLTLINDMNKRIYALTAAVIALSNK